MPGSVRRYVLSLGIALCALIAGPIAAAQASDATIVTSLNNWALKIARDENAVGKGLTAYRQHHKVRPLFKALHHELPDLHALRHALAQESASTAKGRKAKADLIQGLGLRAKAYTTLANLVKASRGNGVPVATLQPVLNTYRKGQALIKEGIKLLRREVHAR